MWTRFSPGSSLSREQGALYFRLRNTHNLVVLRWWTVLLVVVWLIAAVAVVRSGILLGVPSSITLSGSAALTFAVFLLLLRFSDGFRLLLQRLDPSLLTLVQSSRIVGGTILLYLSWRELIPLSFGIPGGVGDILAAVTAPTIAIGLRKHMQPRTALIWHVLALAHLLLAILLGSLTSPVPRVLGGPGSSQVLHYFPYGMIPMFVGPVLISTHLAVIAHLILREKQAISPGV
jgi:hypothetical protein